MHRNVRMHIMNVPIGYLPYLAHPDWTVRRRSGFLTPTFVMNTDLGLVTSIPYFQVIDETRDVEFTPYVFSIEEKLLRTRYRQKWDNSEAGVIWSPPMSKPIRNGVRTSPPSMLHTARGLATDGM